MDDSYPSPLKSQTKYVGNLNRRRAYDAPPYPSIIEFKLEELSSEDYQTEYSEWVDRQVALDTEGFRLLAEHCGLDINADDFFAKVALHLARNHVPAFRMNNIGKQVVWTKVKLKLLALRVYIMTREGRSRADAIKELSQPGNAYAYDGVREGLRNRVIEGEKLLDLDNMEKYSLQTLQEAEKHQAEIVLSVDEAIKTRHK